MLVFVAIAIVGFLFVAGAVIFGHGDLDHSMDHAVDHGGGDGADGTISIFSTPRDRHLRHGLRRRRRHSADQ